MDVALTTARLMQLAQAPEVAPRIVALCLPPAQQLPILSEPLAALTALEYLELFNGQLLGSVEALWQLPRLTCLSFDGASASGSWSGLSRLTRLCHLSLRGACDNTAVAAALPALGRLTCLNVGQSRPGVATASWSSISWLSALQELHLVTRQAAHVLCHLPPASLRRIDLFTGNMPELPAHLSCCTALEHLYFGHIRRDGVIDGQAVPLAADSFSNLAPLGRLQSLVFEHFRITPAEVPLGLTALSSLTCLTLEFAGAAGGWHRLQARHCSASQSAATACRPCLLCRICPLLSSMAILACRHQPKLSCPVAWPPTASCSSFFLLDATCRPCLPF